ncbi:Bardet-Biedl syndrome 1 protein-like [Paramacrobiotus metropolitanus]|uniref:Bardet-Biedl syndrome 1 protein-like n=1 Tax=Paramacrobiotus metropolitanus TaxID=2943436 RepID=UPI002445BB5A|nr:Bardet-Biedl syndrome 1 protein-like [Paramacrobiotus metropolitanus]
MAAFKMPQPVAPSSGNSSPTPAPIPAKWITLVEDQDARIFTFGSCMALADLRGDGKCALVVGELSHTSGEIRLRSLDGQMWRDAFKLAEFPSAVLPLHLETPDAAKRIVPAIAVSVGNAVLIYKTMKPLCRYQLPHLQPLKEEQDLWTAAREKRLTVPDLFNKLNALKETYSEALFTQRTKSFLLISNDERDYFVQEYSEKPLFRSSVITCMATVNKKLKEEGSDQYLVLGTESRHLYIVDALTNLVKAQHEVPDVPAAVATHGTFHERYRLFISCRDGKIYTITKDFSEITCVAPNDRPITMLNTGKHLVVPCMDGVIYFYKGKNNELHHKCEHPIACAEVIKYEPTGFKAVAVALMNKEVLFFKEDQLVDTFTCDDVVTAMKYGKFDREDGALALVLRNGTVIIKLIKRRAKFEQITTEKVIKPIQQLIPKRSTLFLDQTQRERENCKKMNTAVFDNITRMKYEINKRYAESLQLQSGNASVQEEVLITPQLLGSGPFFKLIVRVQNMSTETAMTDYSVFLQSDKTMYALPQTYIEVPFVVPRGKFAFARLFKFIGNQPSQGEITIHLFKGSRPVPVMSIVAVIPESDVGLV